MVLQGTKDRTKICIHIEIQIRTINKIEDTVEEDKDGDQISVNTKIRAMADGGITQDLHINENTTGKSSFTLEFTQFYAALEKGTKDNSRQRTPSGKVFLTSRQIY